MPLTGMDEGEKTDPDTFAVLGAVNRPGSFPHVSAITVEEALRRAGGVTVEAASLRLMRGAREVLRVYNKEAMNDPAFLSEILLPGDRLMVIRTP